MSGKKQKTILLVEDNAILAMTGERTLQKFGYDVVTTDTGEKAVNLFKEGAVFDLILMDIDLGDGIDGTQAAEIILQNHNVPVLFLSSHTEPEVVSKTEKITSYGYVVKNSGNTVLDASIKMAFKLFDANQKIVKSEAKEKAMISNISDVIGIIGIDGIVKYKSPNVKKWFGWQQEDFIGIEGLMTVHPDDIGRVQKVFNTLLEKENSTITMEFRYKCKDESYRPVELTATNLVNDPNINGILINYHDVTERKQAEEALLLNKRKLIEQKEEAELNNERLESLLHISQYKTTSIQELLDFALDEAIKLTDSKIGYIYFYDETKRQFILNSWSKDVMSECAVLNYQTIYDLDKTGCWGEAVRQRKPFILNDYNEFNPYKKGTPDGHVKLLKFLTIPVFSENKIVAVAAVANKETDYNNFDVRQLTLLMDSVWKITEHKQAEVALQKKMDELQQFQRLTVGRELAMIELKKEINELLKKSGQEEKYRIVK
jgi:PAS domain S-box-containing protein